VIYIRQCRKWRKPTPRPAQTNPSQNNSAQNSNGVAWRGTPSTGGSELVSEPRNEAKPSDGGAAPGGAPSGVGQKAPARSRRPPTPQTQEHPVATQFSTLDDPAHVSSSFKHAPKHQPVHPSVSPHDVPAQAGMHCVVHLNTPSTKRYNCSVSHSQTRSFRVIPNMASPVYSL